jgi:hypothetical protein
MYIFDEQDGFSSRLVKLWRSYRGTDKWPLVPARDSAKEFVEGPEGGGYYKLLLEYQLPATSEPVVVCLTANPTSLPSDAWIGDEIQLRVHPSKIGNARFEDATESAGQIRFAFLCVAGLGCVLLLRGCK